MQTYRLSDYLFGCEDDTRELLSSIPLVEDDDGGGAELAAAAAAAAR